jgi:hypothetical protein
MDSKAGRNVGGRGKKSYYPTTTVRVPEVLKQSIQSIVEDFYQVQLTNVESGDNINSSSEDDRLAKIQDLIDKFREENKPTKRPTNLDKFILELEKILAFEES